VHYRADLQSAHKFRCYDNIHKCKFIALYTANAYSAERELSASACTRALWLLIGLIVLIDRSIECYRFQNFGKKSHVSVDDADDSSDVLDPFILSAVVIFHLSINNVRQSHLVHSLHPVTEPLLTYMSFCAIAAIVTRPEKHPQL